MPAMASRLDAANHEMSTISSLTQSTGSLSTKDVTDASFVPSMSRENSNAGNTADSGPLEVSLTSTSPVNRDKRKKRESWRVAVAVAAVGTCIVLLSNILLLTVAATLSSDTTEMIATLYHGSCKTADALTIALHLLINILSSLMLSASNYTMQCLAAPTRTELDRAHSRGTWLDVGVPSLRNILWGVSKRRSAMWVLLCISSFPIHFVYNSAIFKSTNANLYGVALVSETFLLGFPFVADMEPSNPESYPALRQMQAVFRTGSNQTKYSVENLTNSQCIERYSATIVNQCADLLVIAAARAQNHNKSFFGYESDAGGFPQNFNWMRCGLNQVECNVRISKANASTWQVDNYEVAYCLSLQVEDRCEVQFSIQVLAAVIASNAIKVAVMIWTLFFQNEVTLVTVGDAIASYLDYPDEYTAQQCYLDKWTASKSLASKPSLVHNHKQSTLVDYFALFIEDQGLVLKLSADVIVNVPGTGAQGIIKAIVIANSPHVVCSIAYFISNGLFTAMILSSEWSRYYLRPKPLRTSTPRGKQRSKYYLQLPYKFSMPLIVISMILHGLISQSIFLSRIEVYNPNGTLSDVSNHQSGRAGISQFAMLILIIFGFIAVFVTLGIGLRSFKTHMPVAASCSLAIAAACHRPPEDVDAAYLPVSWGEVKRMGTEDLGHCCFTSEEVSAIEPGRLYAGRKDD